MVCFQYYRKYEEIRSNFNLLNKTNSLEILTKFLKPPIVFETTKKKTTLWKCEELGD